MSFSPGSCETLEPSFCLGPFRSVGGSFGGLECLGGLEVFNIEAVIIRIGFWGPLYHNDNKEPPK